jgi:hypothetical protein
MLRAALLVLLFASSTQAYEPPRAAQRRPVQKKAEPLKIPTMRHGAPPEVDDVGRLIGQRYQVHQVIDEANALVWLEWYTNEPQATGRTTLKEHREFAWIRLDTRKLVDGRLVKDDRVFKVVGTKRYMALGGVKTVIVLEPVSAWLIEEESDK